MVQKTGLRFSRLVLVANKQDIADEAVIQTGETFAEDRSMSFYVMESTTGREVNKMFKKLVE